MWADAVSGLGSEEIKFALNAATDTLPHNSNLAKWRRGFILDHCKLCGQKQTLHHVLNHCPVALDKRRYNPHLDTILSLISDLAHSSLPPSFQLLVDLPDSDYHFPSHICSTDLRPDLVVWSDQQHLLFLVELTVCFECGFDDARRRKDNRYREGMASGVWSFQFKLVVEELSISRVCQFSSTIFSLFPKKFGRRS